MVCIDVKNGKPKAIEAVVNKIKGFYEVLEDFNTIFDEDAVLVPVPGSSILVQNGIWIPELLANQLVDVQLGVEVKKYLKRTVKVPKSATAPKGQRPTVNDHYNSISVVNTEIFTHKRIVLIDDVITKGSTIFACYLRLKEVFPDVEIVAFAPFRTQGFIPDIEKFVEPYTGTISYNGYYTTRND